MCLDASLEEEVLVCGDLRGNLVLFPLVKELLLVNICSTGGDGCICYLEYDRDHEKLQFTGMKQVKELTEFIIWNLITEAKVVQIPCGGWRRPNSYFLGDVPELRGCFAYVKDEIIYIHRHWVPDCERKIYPQNLHLQFHGKEMHSLCFISENTRIPSGKERGFFPNACWLETGCEDGTVRLTRYDELSFDH
ncbi:hypothetical protein POM88_041578 [Heracleum sosnowskyi]|uniref:Uncharacterized protein n=1 Tax=Heracleum sosnowskyi TaxID=360622 RepID=A0AAD8MAV1_9APIA|nr:hypothetical protein POM88_041578 [Heracleum sosnowskyi]